MKSKFLFTVALIVLLLGCQRDGNNIIPNQSTASPLEVPHNFRRFVVDCRGQYPCNNPVVWCIIDRGSCLDDVIIVANALAELDDAITNNTQAAYFAIADYADIFNVQHFDEIEIGLESGNLLFNRYSIGDKTWYVVVPAQFSGASIDTVVDVQELVIPVSVQ